MTGKRYEVKVDLGFDWRGNRLRKSIYSSKSKRDAKKKAAEFLAKYNMAQFAGGDAARKDMTFGDWAKQCLETYKKPYVSGITYSGTYLQPLENHLLPKFGEMRLSDLRPTTIQRYVNEQAKCYRAETVKKDYQLLNFLLARAVDEGLLASNPANKSIHLPRIQRAEKRAWNQQQYDTAYQFAEDYPGGVAIQVLLETGISRSELLGLTWENLDVEHRAIQVRSGLVAYRNLEKGGWEIEDTSLKNAYRCRDIPITNDRLWEKLITKPRVLTFIQPDRDPLVVETEKIFHSPTGLPYQPQNWNNRVFIPFMNALVKAHPEIPKLSAHELRHTRATLWVRQGIQPTMVAKLLGHSDLKMLLRIYDHTDTDTLRNAIEAAQRG